MIFKRFYTTLYSDTKPGILAKDRTKRNLPFKVIGTDYVGTIYCKVKKKQPKSYLLLFTCSITRAVHLELLPNPTTLEFIKAFKRLITRRRSPPTLLTLTMLKPMLQQLNGFRT